MDDGSSSNAWPKSLKSEFTKNSFQPRQGKLIFGNKSFIKTLGVGSYGILTDILLCDGLTIPLVSGNFLTKKLHYKILHDEDRIFVLKLVKHQSNTKYNYEINKNYYRTIASATLGPDRLFHIDDMTRFLDPSLQSDDEAPIVSYGPTSEVKVYTPKERRLGSHRVMIKSARQYLNYLEWLHTRMGHVDPILLKYMARHEIVLGLGITWKDVKHLEMGICDACMHARMHALPIYASLSRKSYGIFEYLTID